MTWSLADGTARAVEAAGLRKVGLLGTNFVMREEFLRGVLEQHGIETVVPQKDADCELVHRSIFEEFGHGRFLDSTRAEYLRIMDGLAERGAQGVILGCTEIPMLIKPEDVPIPTFDTTEIHVRAAVDFALSA